MQRFPCRTCGELIHPDTAAKNNGLCMPCKGSYRAGIEAGKKRREQERLYDQSAERKYWFSLVKKESEAGFQALSESEKIYFALSCLVGEVYNGGFDQFFSNLSGAMYGYALSGLLDVEAHGTAALLEEAKDVLFGSQSVPVDRQERNNALLKAEGESRLDALDKAFWADKEGLGERCKQYAIGHALYKDE
jgi:Domain of unknown function (DUF4375)